MSFPLSCCTLASVDFSTSLEWAPSGPTSLGILSSFDDELEVELELEGDVSLVRLADRAFARFATGPLPVARLPMMENANLLGWMPFSLESSFEALEQVNWAVKHGLQTIIYTHKLLFAAQNVIWKKVWNFFPNNNSLGVLRCFFVEKC